MVDVNLAYLSFILLIPFFLLLLLSFIVKPRPVKISLKSRHVFITGGSSGIGLTVALQAVSGGAHVSILVRGQCKLEEVKESIHLATGIEVGIFAADVRDSDAVQRAVDEAGPTDVFICNQGVFMAQGLEKQELDEVKFMINVNLMGTFNLIKAALRGMKNWKDCGPASIALTPSQAGQELFSSVLNFGNMHFTGETMPGLL